jgi:hypothetical protein
LHTHFGPDSKPHACQTYPYRTIRTAGVSSISLDFSCRTAAELLDAPFSPESAVRPRPAPDGGAPGAELIPGLEVDAALYADIEAALEGALALPAATVEERLLSGALLLDAVFEALDADDSGALAQRQTTLPLLEGERDRGLRILLRAARARRADSARQYFLISRLIELVEQWLVAHDLGGSLAPFWSSTRRVVEWFDIEAETAGITERAARVTTRLGRSWARRAAGVDRVLANYVWQSLLGRHLQVEYGLALGYRVLLVSYALVRLHTVGFAALEGATSPEACHAVRAVQTVERNFGHLPLLLRFFKRTSVMNLLLDRDFAPHMVLLPDPEEMSEPWGEFGDRHPLAA